MNDSAFLSASDFGFRQSRQWRDLFLFQLQPLIKYRSPVLSVGTLFNITFSNLGVTFYMAMCLIGRHK